MDGTAFDKLPESFDDSVQWGRQIGRVGRQKHQSDIQPGGDARYFVVPLISSVVEDQRDWANQFQFCDLREKLVHTGRGCAYRPGPSNVN